MSIVPKNHIKTVIELIPIKVLFGALTFKITAIPVHYKSSLVNFYSLFNQLLVQNNAPISLHTTVKVKKFVNDNGRSIAHTNPHFMVS